MFEIDEHGRPVKMVESGDWDTHKRFRLIRVEEIYRKNEEIKALLDGKE